MAIVGALLIVVLAIITPAGMGLEDAMYWWASLVFGIGVAFIGLVDIGVYFKKPELLDNLFTRNKDKYADVVDVEPENYVGSVGNEKEPKKWKKKKYDTVI